MTEAHEDLLPLFLDEARDRLLHLNSALQGPEISPEDMRQIRRELHALKGASRMMGLHEVSDLCHQVESLVESPTSLGEAARIGIEMAARVEELADLQKLGVHREEEDGGGLGKGRAHTDASRKRASAVQSSVRVAYPIVDRLSDAAIGVRVHAEAGLAALERVSRIGETAAAATGGADPHQVLVATSASLRRDLPEIETFLREIKRLGRTQIEDLQQLQVYSLRPFLNRMAKHAMDTASRLDKKIEVKISAGKTQLDRRIVGALEAGFVHLVDNAVDHGIEDPEGRSAAGKPDLGRLELRAVAEGDRARITVVDDGRGLDYRAITEAAVRRGVINSEEVESMTNVELQQLILRPGFTTREKTTGISGRGIGLDAVADVVDSVGGNMSISAVEGRGTRVEIQVPVTRRGERILVVRVEDAIIGIPAAAVRAFGRLDPQRSVQSDERWTVCIGSTTAPLVTIGFNQTPVSHGAGLAVLLSPGGSQVALAVHEVYGEEEVLARPLSKRAGVHEVFESMALLATGRPVPIVSVRRFDRAYETLGTEGSGAGSAQRTRVLLVDDSKVTRQMLRRVLLDAGFDVVAVASAEGAFDSLAQGRFDCVVTDIEMPGKNGLELTRHIREAEATAQIPVIVVSTRNHADDRLAGLEAGADAFLAKQTLETDELITLIRRFGADDDS